MASLLLISLLLLLPAYRIFKLLNGFRITIQKAKPTGIPYYLAPAEPFNAIWRQTFHLWVPFIRLLPQSWLEDSLDLLEAEPAWRQKFKAFERRNTDMFLLTTPGVLTLEVADPDVVRQIVTRRADFEKPVSGYKVLELFGRNVVSTEGSVWKQHRRITQPPFSERNNAVVWEEASFQASEMLKAWTGPHGEGNIRQNNLGEDCMRLLLHVISRASFSVRLQWPGSDTPIDSSEDLNAMESIIGASSSEVPEGHSMSFSEALGTVLENVLLFLALPKWFLKYNPSGKLRRTSLAYTEWTQYQRELLQKKIEMIRSDRAGAASDLLGALVKAAGYDESISPDKDHSNGKLLLSEEEIMGNAFIFMLAGHETTANTLHFALINLALSSKAQDSLHADLDRILPKDTKPGDWKYEQLYTPLSNSFAMAVIYETLRMFPPVTAVPKRTTTAQAVNWHGKAVVIPPRTPVSVVVAALHRHPRYWPTAPKGEKPQDNLDSFIPARWFWDIDYPGKHEPSTDAGEATGVERNSTLFKPAPGSFIPFSDGARSCLGRKFALVESIAILAVLMQHYSIELDVADFLEDAQGDEKKAYSKARERAEWLLDAGSWSVLTLQIRKGKVPFRFVKRGEERFKKFAEEFS